MSTTNGTTSSRSGSGTDFGGGVSLSYDAATGNYTVRDSGGLSATFLATSAAPADAASPVTIFNQTSGNVSDQLILFKTGTLNPTLQLSYVSYGAWQRVTNNGATANVAQQYFLYGIHQRADQPSTGSASYTTLVDGTWSSANAIYTLGGTSSFTANFGSRTVATTLDLVGKSSVDASLRNFARFNGSGSIAALGGGFSGTLTQQGAAGDGKVYSGGFNGAFFGPSGQEVGYTFSLTAPGGGAAAGVLVGKAN